MEELPRELSARRQAIYDRVVGTGRMRRRRRIIALASVAAVIVAVPVAAVALSGTDNPRPRIALANPSTTVSTTDPTATESSTVSVSSTEPATTSVVPTSVAFPVVTQPLIVPSQKPTTSTSVVVCRNNRVDAVCGRFRYDPPVTNEPGHLAIVSVSPAVPKVGQAVTFTLRATDPDSSVYEDGMWCNEGVQSFGDDSGGMGCAVDCAFPGYGPWDPPAPHPSDLTFTVKHPYTKAGTFTARFTIAADICAARPDTATATTKITVTATPPTP